MSSQSSMRASMGAEEKKKEKEKKGWQVFSCYFWCILPALKLGLVLQECMVKEIN